MECGAVAEGGGGGCSAFEWKGASSSSSSKEECEEGDRGEPGAVMAGPEAAAARGSVALNRALSSCASHSL